jgi:hypothetical protein
MNNRSQEPEFRSQNECGFANPDGKALAVFAGERKAKFGRRWNAALPYLMGRTDRTNSGARIKVGQS